MEDELSQVISSELLKALIEDVRRDLLEADLCEAVKESLPKEDDDVE